jgi:8-oxo-dGTP pyrophosphatase MutT (NUDIX family)
MNDSTHDANPSASWLSVDQGAHDQTLLETWLFRLRRERYRSRASGKTHDYFVTHLASGVHVIAVTPERQVLFVRQFRAGSRSDSLETPGGLLEPGEDPLVGGARELIEETGYAGESPVLICTHWPNPALLAMRISTVVITNARPTRAPSLDADEEVAVELVPVKEIPTLIRSGRIDHAACVAGLLHWLYLRAFANEA